MAEGGFRRGSDSVLYSPDSSVQCEKASEETCRILTLIGYGPVIRKKRTDSYREIGRLITARYCGLVTTYITGSKAEGLTCYFESDTDCMYVIEGVICLQDDVASSNLPGECIVLMLNSRVSYPGHCRLMLKSQSGGFCNLVHNALCDDGSGGAILSSDLFISECSNVLTLSRDYVRRERAGPSIPYSSGFYHRDNVFALRCHCPSILQRWAERPRHWPPPDIVQKVVSMRAFVSPVGFKGSKYKHVEWRICFNTGETELIKNLNDTQTKLYIILKMIVKDILIPRHKEVTSYTLKNIVFWLVENNLQTLFHDKSLFHWLHEGLKELRTAISTKQLPYYMIPERNLMAASGLEGEQQRTWLATITDIMYEGPRILRRLQKIRQAIIAYPEPLLSYSRMRTELEMLQLEYQKRHAQCMDENLETDFILQEIHRRMVVVMMELTLNLTLRGLHMEGNGVNNVEQILDRASQIAERVLQ